MSTKQEITGTESNVANESIETIADMEEMTEDGLYTTSYYVNHSVNSVEGRGYNFICFDHEETAYAIENLRVEIIVEDEVIESFEINSPNSSFICCISPLLSNLSKETESYEVRFTANATCTWSRLFRCEDCEDLHVNVIMLDPASGEFDSVLAG